MTTSIVSVSRTELDQRRRKLRRQRRIRFFQTLWRTLAVSSIAGGLVWVVRLPIWVIQRPDQVQIEGNRFIPTQTIRSLLPIPYPQSLLRVEPQKIAHELKAKAPIADVRVNRHLFPPSLTVQVKERYPVAIAYISRADAQTSIIQLAKAQKSSQKAGLLDEGGMWIPLERLVALDQAVQLPQLKVVGRLEYYRLYWKELYQAIRRSPIKVTELDFQDPANLILKTELGNVHLGPYRSSQFPDQLKTLDRMRKLPELLNMSQVDYIDLRNPTSPMVQMQKP